MQYYAAKTDNIYQMTVSTYQQNMASTPHESFHWPSLWFLELTRIQQDLIKHAAKNATKILQQIQKLAVYATTYAKIKHNDLQNKPKMHNYCN